MNREALGFRFMVAGILMILAAENLYWFDPIIYAGVLPMSLPLFSGVMLPPPTFYPFSYGVAVFLLLGLAYVGGRVKHPVVVAWAAFFCLLLGLNCLLQVGFSQPSWLYQFMQGRYQYLGLTGFANHYTIPDMAPSIAAAHLTGIHGLYDRLIDAWYSLYVGWPVHILGSLLFLGGALARVGNWQTIRSMGTPATIIFVLFLGWHLTGCLAGETSWELGLRAERSGNLESAKRYYHWAIKCDQWNRLDTRVYERLGAIAGAQNQLDAPEYHLVEGIRGEVWAKPDAALAELQLATEAKDPDLAHVARIERARFASQVALQIYHKAGAPGMAAHYWQTASSTSDMHVMQDYLAARGYQDAGNYASAERSLNQVAKNSSTLIIQADVYDALGDVYYHSKDVETAREQYLQSEKVLMNFIEYKDSRAIKCLSDNLQP